MSHVTNLRRLERRPYDWAAEELTPAAVRIIAAQCKASPLTAVRQAGAALVAHFAASGFSLPAAAGPAAPGAALPIADRSSGRATTRRPR